jgi:hypothetical protein
MLVSPEELELFMDFLPEDLNFFDFEQLFKG